MPLNKSEGLADVIKMVRVCVKGSKIRQEWTSYMTSKVKILLEK